MKYINKSIKSMLASLMILALASSLSFAGNGPGGPGGSGGGGGTAPAQVFDTSFAVEFSYSCLGGGCHETDQNLVNEYAESKMTHTMVKCNACHGTHTAATVGLEKPNLTGYYPGIGATGYRVDTDRCKVCHNNEHTGGGRKSGDNCYSCHAPHVFSAGR
ncbi:MAG: hypothetical protein OQL06_03050 [Gammaproteobacteria bacterium]|nr:hypothetical protein [Gammaproteobacteria bacterium]